MDLFHRAMAKIVDVGGWHCPCCAPAPKDRQKARRYARRRLHDMLRKDLISFEGEKA